MARKAAAQVDENAPPPIETAPVLNEPVEIEVTDEAPVEPVIDVSPQEPEPPKPAESIKPVEDPAIKQRLDELDRANKELARQNKEQAEQLARGQQQLGNEQWQRFNAQYEGVTNALGAAQAELAAAKQAYKVAHGEGDVDALVEAQEQIGSASFEIKRLSGIKDQMDVAAENARKAPPPRQQQQQPTTEQMLANSGLSERSKAWLRARPEYLTDVDKNTKLRHLDEVARFQSNDMDRTTDAYFERLEILLGMKQEAAAPTPANGSGNGAHPPAQTQQRQAAQVSAPPTREAPSMTTGRAATSTKVRLSAEEQEIAWNTRPREDMTRQEANELYGKNKLRVQREKQQQNGG